MRIYLSGPMSGLPDFNYPAFHTTAALLRHVGYCVMNPAETGVRPDWAYADYLRHDLQILLAQAEGVATLPGWRTSRGARLEVTVAEMLGLPIAPVITWLRRAGRPDAQTKGC
ncbi:protein of unknown function [Sulfobacillus thermosulfidooxidans DSM 9293]|uniref:DUF4406 domain-containing protein n=1 Tax=Sulfobacillus thermosulfidooxidans (strain DSM 9293 / VKM B-1269 / AT-1) TaxID=929705 RepID=A0A1W1W6X5_SULTA|nr:DUF4406 domain-containing protein [Sulfobacillus thermosulfidooxidans]SMC02015.1 protein of unknown function [Sulfobacillus thermosulfidooxidans DSM 9293]